MYVDLAGLARYKSDFGAWARGALLPKDAAAARVRTAKAGAVSFVPVQQTPLDVSVDFLFSETPPASGDKGPENPSTITGVSSVKVTRCGKNVLPSNYVYDMMTHRGVTVTRNQDGSFHLKGTVTDNLEAYLTFFSNAVLGVVPNPIGIGKTLTISVVCSDSNVYGALYKSPSTSSWGSPMMIYAGTPVTYTMPDNVKSAMFRIIATRGSTLDCDVHCQIEYGQTATEWEAPADTDYTVPFGGIYYGGTLDVASGVMTVKSQKVAIDGSCSYAYLGGLGNGTGFVAVVVTIHALEVTKGYFATGSCACNRFPVFSTETPEFTKAGMFLANPSLSYFNYKQVRFYLSLDMLGLSSSVTQQEVASATKAWFTANPADAVFTFAEPFSIVQLTPTEILSLTQSSDYDPRVNTVYSDQQAVQVGYLKHPSAASADLRNAVVSLGGGV